MNFFFETKTKKSSSLSLPEADLSSLEEEDAVLSSLEEMDEEEIGKHQQQQNNDLKTQLSVGRNKEKVNESI